MRRLISRLVRGDESNSPDRNRPSGLSPRSSSNSGATVPFEYIPLSSQSSFRVLRLRRHLSSDTGPEGLPLYGSLVEASFAHPPKYFALSYTWGDAALCDEINLDGRTLRITASCAAALRRMRGKFERLVWIDSICIDQSGTPQALWERGRQVAVMDQIYSAAEQVNVFLGEGDAGTDAACEALKSLVPPYLGAKLPGPQQESCRRRYERLADDILRSTPEFPNGQLHGIFRLPWFKRTWVVQEVALGRKVMFYCGKHLLHFNTIVAGADFTRLPYTRAHLHTMSFHWKSYLGYHDALQSFVVRLGQGEPVANFNITLSSILMLPALKLEVTRPEDKIFGLYGVCKRFGYELLPPDYRKPLGVVYAEAARAMIHYDRSLEILCAVVETSGWDEFDLPSWVPNFAGCLQKWSPSNPPHMYNGATSESRVSGSSRYEYLLELGSPRLKVRGRRLGIVLGVGLPWMVDSSASLLGDLSEPTGQYIDSLLDSIGQWLDIARSAFPDESLAMTAMVQTILLAREAAKSSVQEFLPIETMVHYLSILVAVARSGQHRQEQSNPLILASPHDNMFFITIGKWNLSEAMQRVIQQIFNAGWKNMFRVVGGPSESGEHLGLGAHMVAEEDIIVVFSGSPSAAILRPWLDGYRYVGPASVDGIMNGEFWKAGSETDNEWFTLI